MHAYVGGHGLVGGIWMHVWNGLSVQSCSSRRVFSPVIKVKWEDMLEPIAGACG